VKCSNIERLNSTTASRVLIDVIDFNMATGSIGKRHIGKNLPPCQR
jgi:hypothetical protein